MGKFIQSNLGRNESVILEAKFSIFGGLGIIGEELGFTNKNVIGKVGIIKRRTLTAPLNKVQGVKTGSGVQEGDPRSDRHLRRAAHQAAGERDGGCHGGRAQEMTDRRSRALPTPRDERDTNGRGFCPAFFLCGAAAR